MLTPQERRFQTLLKILAVLFGLAVFGYLLPALIGPNRVDLFVQLPFVTNSVVKVGVLGLLAFIAAGNVRRYREMTLLVIWGHVISILAVIAVLIWGMAGRSVSVQVPFTGALLTFPVFYLLWASIILDSVIVGLLTWLYLAAERARYGLLYLSPMQFRALHALAEVLVKGEPELVPEEEVARNVDRYLSQFRAQSKWITRLVLIGIQVYPLLSFHPPFSYLSAEARERFIKKRFYQDVTRRLTPSFWRMLTQAMIRMAKQLAYLGYYNDPRTFASVGYVPFSERPDQAQRLQASPPESRRPLIVDTESDVHGDAVTGDVVIIGSGAAAAVLAHGLVRQGRQVLMIERGTYEDPSTFTEDEVDMLARLYADGALQLSRDFRFQVLQGSCVGGSTVVNNAVCFDLPPPVLDRWNDPQGLEAGLEADRLGQAFAEVRRLVGVERQDHANLNRGATFFNDGVRALGLDRPPNDHAEVEANIHGCLGCGYCNIGCSYGKKLSMLDTVLPRIQRDYGPEALRIIAGCEAIKIRGRGREITSIRCRFQNGRMLDVKGKTFIVAAGAVSSSLLLLRSGVGGELAGKYLSFNMGAPMTAVFDRKVDSYDGLQISHYLDFSPSRRYVFETWFNPPVAQALNMPGWFEDHFNNMRRYDQMTAAGVLVATEANAEVRRAGLTGREIKYVPTQNDLDTLLEGLVVLGDIFLAGGATCVIPNTWDYYEFETSDALHRLPDLIKDNSDLTLGTGHPQGGNRLSRDPAKGVVGSDFRVHGYDNLYLCDASVFPTSIGVNPQLTVMALAHYAVPFVAA